LPRNHSAEPLKAGRVVIIGIHEDADPVAATTSPWAVSVSAFTTPWAVPMMVLM
jgi:hypothetical protein